MLSLAPGLHLNAQDSVQPPVSVKDSEAFFLFLANSIEDEGELITPIDIEEIDLEERKSQQTLSQKQEEVL